MNSISAKTEKILIIKFSGIGDIVNVTPAIRLLNRELPTAQIDFLASDWTTPAIQNNKYLNNIYLIENKWISKLSLSSFFHIAKMILKLKKERYTAALVFQQSVLFKWFVKLVGIQKSVCFGTNLNNKNEVVFDESVHIIDNNINLTQRLLSTLGYNQKTLDFELKTTEKQTDWFVLADEKKEAEKIFTLNNLSENNIIIGLIAGGAYNPVRDEREIRQWGVENYKELIRNFKKLPNVKILLIGGANDIGISEALIQGNEDFVINLTGKTNLRISAALLSKCNLVISNDTGPMHVAGALKIPLIGIFGPTGAKFALPPGDNCTAIQSQMPCSPCYYRVFNACIFDEIKCLKSISAQLVFNTAVAALKM